MGARPVIGSQPAATDRFIAAGCKPDKEHIMRLGTFSVSLAVKDLQASKAFYEKLGFEMIGGEPAQNWVILRQGSTKIGLFQGMFERNIMTFNPGWDDDGSPLERFDDVRAIQQRLIDAGIEPQTPAADGDGPASMVVVDPDGNPILFDQHVPNPGQS